MSYFNPNNTEWKGQKSRLFMGQQPALHDSINVSYPEIQSLYKRQVAGRWVETEFNFEQSRLDLLTCPDSVYKIMLMNLAFQWEADSVAARAIAPMLAPFVTDSSLWNYLLEISGMEVVHALTYSEIVRQCVADPSEVFKMVMESKETQGRVSVVTQAFDELAKAGAMYSLGQLSKEEAYLVVYKAVCALYMLERLQFMASFAATFAICEQGYFQGIGVAVQKILQDEIAIHAEGDVAILRIERATPEGKAVHKAHEEIIAAMLNEVVEAELEWSEHLFGDGRSVVGLNPVLLKEWVVYNAQSVYAELGLQKYNKHGFIASNPLPWMSNYIDIDKRQNAMQEATGNNYLLNTVKNDLNEGEEFDF